MGGCPRIAVVTRRRSWPSGVCDAGCRKRELARAVGLPRTTYWRLETGRVRDPKLRALTNLAIALGCPNGVDDIIEDAWRSWYPFDLSSAPEPPDHATLWRGSPDGRACLVHVPVLGAW